MANNQLLASDNFASGSLAAGWSLADGLTNVCKVVAGSPNVTEPQNISETDGQVWTGLVWPLDQVSELTINAFTNEATTLITLLVRWQTSQVSGYEAQIFNNTISIFSINSGTKTQIGSTVSGLTVSAGDIWSFHAEGAILSLIQNFKVVLQVPDTTYLNWPSTGAPGYSQFSSVNVAHSQVSSWRGYSAVQQDGIWQKQGIAIPSLAADFSSLIGGTATCSQILFEGNAQLLSGTVYKIWFCGAQPQASNTTGNIGYAESLDSKTWVRRSTPVLTGYVSPTIWKSGSTYYMFAQPITGFGTAPYAVFTSPDGIAWTLQNASGVSRGSTGAWDDGVIFGCGVVAIINGTWYALYYGNGSGLTGSNGPATGLVTSPDGINWTKSGSNPVRKSFGTQQAVYTTDNETFYIWGGEPQGGRGGADTFDPGICVRYTVTNLFTTWTNRTVSFNPTQGYECVNTVVGQTWLNAIIDVGGNTYGFTTSGDDGASPRFYQISLVKAPAPISSLVKFNEDAVSQVASDIFVGGAGPLSANWTPAGGVFSGALQIVAGNIVEAAAINTDAASFYTGNSFSPNQYSEITIQTAGAGNTITPIVRGNIGTNKAYYAVITGPVGSADTACHLLRLNGSNLQLGPSVQITVQAGDVIRLQVVTGSDGFPVLTLLQNGALVVQAQDQSASPILSGNPGMYISVTTAVANSQISKWAGGNANVIPNFPGMIDGMLDVLKQPLETLTQL